MIINILERLARLPCTHEEDTRRKRKMKRRKRIIPAVGEMHCLGRLGNLHLLTSVLPGTNPVLIASQHTCNALFLLFMYTDNLAAGGIPPSRPFVYFSSPGVVVAVERRTATLRCFFSGQSVYCRRFFV